MGRKYQFFFGIALIIVTECVWINVMHQINLKFSISNQLQKENILRTKRVICNEMKCFPIPISYQNRLSYTDTYGVVRKNGSHEGCDIMDIEDIPGEIPIVSATNGVITNVGWIFLGGYRIGITSDNKNYYYYAHLDSYLPGLKCGKKVCAGQLLGFMGNTGEGEEGTKGKFQTHLHFGIYVEDEQGKEKSVNPYPFLLKFGKE